MSACSAHIVAEVYTASDGIRWRITSAARGHRIISESSEAYTRKADAFRGLLLTTGGTYTSDYYSRTEHGAYEQGRIVRSLPWGGDREEIFVQYVYERTGEQA